MAPNPRHLFPREIGHPKNPLRTLAERTPSRSDTILHIQKWEYQAVPMVLKNLGPRQLTDELDKMAVEGWELILTVTTSMLGETLLFKRPAQE